MSISEQLGAFLLVATGYVTVSFVWGWHKRREQSPNPEMDNETHSGESR
ncbi:hypothetical protein [Salinigranum halophilum]|nr:hypothetical protein [Salinigranum halophilum]